MNKIKIIFGIAGLIIMLLFGYLYFTYEEALPTSDQGDFVYQPAFNGYYMIGSIAGLGILIFSGMVDELFIYCNKILQKRRNRIE